ncbi:Lar family restriction alleviation protein [Providencia rettgeri]|uniref:Lar family restriction alleviation protein n=1 Tax=Providencia rettgeri TaxID=587 RepID=UPI0018C73265|nr:Lar family restriction alleviation protein [Providencia rettgeri]MBG5926121.1 Lar family restriction alleviation protein [Providencia rettgeri]
MSELKKCPECESTKVGVAKKLKFPMWFVICHWCEHRGMAQPSEQQAIVAWNRRANSE